MSRATLYQFLLALLMLYLVMVYAPGGQMIGLLLLLVVILETPQAGQNLKNLLDFIENPTG